MHVTYLLEEAHVLMRPSFRAAQRLGWSKSALMTFIVVTGYSNPNPPVGGHHAMVLSSRDYSASRRHHNLRCAELPDRHRILYAHERANPTGLPDCGRLLAGRGDRRKSVGAIAPINPGGKTT